MRRTAAAIRVFFRSREGVRLVAILGFAAAFAGFGFYNESVRSFVRDKTEEKGTALQLVDAFVTNYSNLRKDLGSANALVPANSVRIQSRFFNRARDAENALRLRWIGRVGRAIATPPADAHMATVIESFVGKSDPVPVSQFLPVDDGQISQTIELAADLPSLYADELKTKQALLNLMTNASKFTPKGGKISLSARVDGTGGLALTVSDNGIGISDKDLLRVLQPFEQVDSPLTRHHDGTGLGLPLVKAIMELHGGRLELASVPGAGTTATIAFPPERLVSGPAEVVSLAA